MNYSKIGLTERGRLTKQFKVAKLLYSFHKPTKTHYSGQTYTYFLTRFTSSKKVILYAMLACCIVANVVLCRVMCFMKKDVYVFRK